MEPYQAVLSAAGGVAPYVWGIADGVLPPGVVLEPTTGFITGRAHSVSSGAEFPLTVQVQDDADSLASRALILRVYASGSLVILSQNLPEALVGHDYIADLSAETLPGDNVAKPLDWIVVDGTLPPGLELSTHAGGSGLISGTPELAGLFSFKVQVSDAQGHFAVHTLALGVHPSQLAVFRESVSPALRWNDLVDFRILSSSTTTARFRVFSGALPAGVTLEKDGKVTGTVATDASTGTYTFVVEAVDARGGRGLGVFSLDVTGPETSAAGCGCNSGSNGLATSLLMFVLLGWAIRRP